MCVVIVVVVAVCKMYPMSLFPQDLLLQTILVTTQGHGTIQTKQSGKISEIEKKYGKMSKYSKHLKKRNKDIGCRETQQNNSKKC